MQDNYANQQENSAKLSVFHLIKPMLVMGLVVAVIAIAASIFSAPSKLTLALEKCEVNIDKQGVTFDPNAKAVFLDGVGQESNGLPYEDIVCILKSLEVTPTILTRMEHTTSLMGQQEASWDNVNVNWTYHPDNGLDISLEVK